MSLSLATNIALDVEAKGGRAYFVGGYVRDKILGLENKDIDIEIHNIDPAVLEEILSKYSIADVSVEPVGKSFGVYKISDLDIAFPRTEVKTGEGHKGFTVTPDPYLSLENSVQRRDLTMNAIMQDVITGEYIDPMHGMDDINHKIIRHVGSKFTEDPLRVFRAARFAARFSDFTVDKATIELCKSIDVSTLPKERVFDETKKALMSDKPGNYLDFLYKTDHLREFFPDFNTLTQIISLNMTEGLLNIAAKGDKDLGFMIGVMYWNIGVEKIQESIHCITDDKELTKQASVLCRYYNFSNDLYNTGNIIWANRLLDDFHRQNLPFNYILKFHQIYWSYTQALLRHVPGTHYNLGIVKESFAIFWSERAGVYKDILQYDLSGQKLYDLGFRGQDIGNIQRQYHDLLLNETHPEKEDILDVLREMGYKTCVQNDNNIVDVGYEDVTEERE